MKFNRVLASRCRSMRRRGFSDQEIIDALNKSMTPADVQHQIDEIRRRNAEYQASNGTRRSEIEPDNRPTIPPEVEAQRVHRVMMRPKTITAFVFGDPLPGESALDRRQSA